MTEKVIEILKQVNPLADYIEEDTSLLNSGLFDSFMIFSAIALMELEWNISIPPAYLDKKYFETVKNICDMLHSVGV